MAICTKPCPECRRFQILAEKERCVNCSQKPRASISLTGTEVGAYADGTWEPWDPQPPGESILRAVKDGNPDEEPTSTCKEHPGDYALEGHCRACDEDRRRYRQWRERTAR